jgi:hypothetical protein
MEPDLYKPRYWYWNWNPGQEAPGDPLEQACIDNLSRLEPTRLSLLATSICDRPHRTVPPTLRSRLLHHNTPNDLLSRAEDSASP